MGRKEREDLVWGGKGVGGGVSRSQVVCSGVSTDMATAALTDAEIRLSLRSPETEDKGADSPHTTTVRAGRALGWPASLYRGHMPPKKILEDCGAGKGSFGSER